MEPGRFQIRCLRSNLRPVDSAKEASVTKILPAMLSLVVLSSGAAYAEDSMFLPSGKSPAMQALEKKRNARCVTIYGPGYAALGDSDTCIRIGGKVGVEYGISPKHNQLMIVPAPALGGFAPTYGPPVGVIRTPSTGSAARADIYVDTRTQTEIGEFRTHVQAGGVRASGSATGPDYMR